jgi:hypothetical protein
MSARLATTCDHQTRYRSGKAGPSSCHRNVCPGRNGRTGQAVKRPGPQGDPRSRTRVRGRRGDAPRERRSSRRYPAEKRVRPEGENPGLVFWGFGGWGGRRAPGVSPEHVRGTALVPRQCEETPPATAAAGQREEKTTGATAQKEEKRRETKTNKGHPVNGMTLIRSVCSGGVLLSREASLAVPSALRGLTSGFGMGPGVSPSL